MATYTDNYQLTKPTYAEQADIGVINSNMNKIDEVMHSSQISLAPAYDSTQTYAEGDVVMYELLMYKCISPTTGVWDGSKWERTTASESGGGGGSSSGINYSTTEQVIGTAEDENGIIKPLYEKMTYISSLSGTGETEYSLGIINIKNVYYVECIAETSTIALPLFYNAGNDNNLKIQMYVSDKLSGKIKINTFNDNRSGMSGTVIIRYTKTTD